MTMQEFAKYYGTRGASLIIRSAADNYVSDPAFSKELHDLATNLESALRNEVELARGGISSVIRE